jgi:hypothetical protein
MQNVGLFAAKRETAEKMGRLEVGRKEMEVYKGNY